MMSCSRGVNGFHLLRAGRANSRGNAVPPSATTRTASTMSSVGAVFATNPLAPSAIAAATYCGVWKVDSTMNAGPSAASPAPDSRSVPEPSGSRRSSKATSASTVASSVRASANVLARPAISTPWASRAMVSPSSTTGWSSMRSTRTITPTTEGSRSSLCLGVHRSAGRRRWLRRGVASRRVRVGRRASPGSSRGQSARCRHR